MSDLSKAECAVVEAAMENYTLIREALAQKDFTATTNARLIAAQRALDAACERLFDLRSI